MGKRAACILCLVLLTAAPANAFLAELAAGAGAVVAAPYILASAGFTTAGITAGSLAAKMMSAAWTSGTGAAVVSTLQSAGAAGLGAAGKVVVGGAGAAATYAARSACSEEEEKDCP